MKLKKEYERVKVSHKGRNVNVSEGNYEYCASIGLGYMFEEPTVSQPKVIKYKAVKGPIPEPEPIAEPESESTEWVSDEE